MIGAEMTTAYILRLACAKSTLIPDDNSSLSLIRYFLPIRTLLLCLVTCSVFISQHCCAHHRLLQKCIGSSADVGRSCIGDAACTCRFPAAQSNTFDLYHEEWNCSLESPFILFLYSTLRCYHFKIGNDGKKRKKKKINMHDHASTSYNMRCKGDRRSVFSSPISLPAGTSETIRISEIISSAVIILIWQRKQSGFPVTSYTKNATCSVARWPSWHRSCNRDSTTCVRLRRALARL